MFYIKIDDDTNKEKCLKNLILFSISSLIWGSTWLAIKFQLGLVDPLISVVYRFFLASVILLLYCRITSLNLKFTLKEHMYMALLGIFLFIPTPIRDAVYRWIGARRYNIFGKHETCWVPGQDMADRFL